jgi:hypothetical protein
VRRRTTGSWRVWLVILLVGVFPAATARAAYIFTKIADTATGIHGTNFISFRSDPAVSGGTVAFGGNFGNDSNRGLFTGSGGPITTIARTGDSAPVGTFTDFGLRGPSISGGKTAFFARFSDTAIAYDGVFTSTGGNWTNVVKSGDVAPNGYFTTIGAPAISGGSVAFVASYWGNGGVFTSQGGAPAPIVYNSGEPPYTYTLIDSVAHSNGTVAFFGNYTDGQNGYQGIFTDSGGPTVLVARSGSVGPAGIWGGFSAPSISGNNVAFYATYTPQGSPISGSGIFRSDGGTTTSIAKSGDQSLNGTFTAFGLSPAISGSQVAFIGTDNYGQRGIYVGQGGALVPVIHTGHSLFGSTVSGLSLGTFALDDDGSGRLVFWYQLANGRRGIALATPDSPLLGDYNNDGVVNASDYVVWRNSLGTISTLSNDAIGGVVGAAHYEQWVAHYGSSRSSVAAIELQPVPEPASGLLLVLGVVFALRPLKRLLVNVRSS